MKMNNFFQIHLIQYVLRITTEMFKVDIVLNYLMHLSWQKYIDVTFLHRVIRKRDHTSDMVTGHSFYGVLFSET